MRGLRFIGLLAMSMLLVIGLAPASSASSTDWVDYPAITQDRGETVYPTAKRMWYPNGGATKDYDDCYNSIPGDNARYAFIETLIEGTYNGDQAGYFHDEDSQFLGLAFYLHDRLNGVSRSKNEIIDAGWINCFNQPREDVGGQLNILPIGQAGPLKSNKARTERIYNVDNGSSTLYTECRIVDTGSGAIGTMVQLILNDGAYTSNMASVLGSYDSDLVQMGKGIAKVLNGQTDVRSSYMFAGKPTCFA